MSLLFCSCGGKHSPADSGAMRTDWKFIFTERKQHFMHLPKCDTLRTSFHYINNTGEVQTIDKVRTSCGCTAVDYKQEPIQPNDSGEISIAIGLDSVTGFFSKTIKVYFKGQHPVVLKIMGKTE